MDFVILFFAVRLSEKRVQFSRISLGAGIGAVYSAFALGFPLLSGLFIKCMALGLMCLPLGARPFKRYLLRCGLALLCSFYLAAAFSLPCWPWGPRWRERTSACPSCAMCCWAWQLEIVLIEFYQRIPHPRSGAEIPDPRRILRCRHQLAAGFWIPEICCKAQGEFPLSSWPKKQQEKSLSKPFPGRAYSLSPALPHPEKASFPPSCPISSLSPPMAKAIPLRHISHLQTLPLPSGYTALLGPDLKLFPL